MIFTDKHIREARMVSIQAHGNQTYDEIYPYKKHLDDVVDILKRFGYAGKYLVAGFLHDIIEDTSLSYNKVKRTYQKFTESEPIKLLTNEQLKELGIIPNN